MAYVALNRFQRGFDRLMAANGVAMTLKRSGEADLPVTGARLMLRITEEAVGNATQTRFRVKIGVTALQASSWASKVPRIGDALVVDGRTCAVLGIWPMQNAGASVAYELEVAG